MSQQAVININVNSKQAQSDVDKLSGSIKSAGGSAASLKLELRKTIQELQGLEPGTARFKELSLRAGELKDQIADTNAVVNQLAGNVGERLTKGITNVVGIGVAGFQAITAGAALFGVESEELEQTMVKLSALMNLSQAVETFSGLDQKIVELRASFGSLTTSTVQQTVAQEGENIATTQGTVATTALGVAMKALPIIAIVAALATLTYGIYQYSTANSEAAQEEKKRKDNLEKLKKQQESNKKAQEQENEAVKGASKEYVGLIINLKNTVAGSKERKKQIDEINSTYGTTLQNLKDESLFQEQLNTSIRDYISLQVIKLRQDKNIEKITGLIQKQEKAERDYADAIAYQTRNAKQMGVTMKESYDNFDDVRIKVDQASGALTKINLRISDLTFSTQELKKEELELNKEFKNNGDAIKTTTKSTKDATDENDKYADALERIKQELDRQRSAEEELQKIKDERLSRTSAQISEELKLIQDFNKQQDELIKVATQREIEALDEKFKKGLVNEEEYKKGRKEIQEGGLSNLLQVETDLLNGKKILLAEDLQNVKDKYKLESEIVLQATKQIQDETKILQLQFQKQQEIDAITNSTLTEEKKQEAILEVKKKYLDEEKSLIELSGKNQIDALTLQKQKLLDNDQLTLDERKQIEEKYNQDVLKVNQDTQTKIQGAINDTTETQKTANEKLLEQVNKVQEYLDLITTLYNEFSNTISAIQDARSKKEQARIDGLYGYEKEKLENQLAEGLVSREQYDNKILELDQQKEQEQEALARKQFETNKKLSMANAVINGAQAVLQALAGSAPPVNFIMAGLVGAMAGVQFGIIANEQFTAAGGGIVPGNGSGNVDSVPSLLAPGETVINAQSSQMYPELLNSVNMAGGGISLKPDLPAVNKNGSDTRVFGDDKVNQPIKAYVVETEITDTQKRIDRIKRSAEF